MTRGAAARPATVHTGAQAEAAALRHLQRNGLTLLARNFRCRAGELDLVMLAGDELVMVEVRYRSRPDPVHPATTVTVGKRRRLLQAASVFLAGQPRFRDQPVRFDVVAVSGPLAAPRYDWYRNAFSTDDVGTL